MSKRLDDSAQLPSVQWINWFGVIIVSALGVVLFLFSTFVTKENYRMHYENIEKRLERIEAKLDAVLERK